MVTEIQYTNIRRVLDDLTDHPMLRNVTLEQVARYTLKFISKHGYSNLYQDKQEEVEIKDFRGLLPCDLISIKQVKDIGSDICLRSMTDSFLPDDKFLKYSRKELSFKTQGRVIFTSFPEGKVLVAYKAIPVDEDGLPLLIENETYIDALEAYIKKQIFTVKFDQQKIPAAVLQNAQQEYAVAARLLLSEFTVPSVSEMESISRMWNTMIPRMREFDKGYRHLGGREYIRKH